MIQEAEQSTMRMEIGEQPDILKNTIRNNQPNLVKVHQDIFNKIILGEINNVLVVARGSSDNAATVGKYILETHTGLPVSLAAPSVVNLYQARLNLFKTLVIGVSQSGKTNEVIDFMKNVKDSAGYTIGITNVENSELTCLGLGSILLCHAGIERAVAATKSFSSTMMIFYLLASTLRISEKKEGGLEEIPDLIRQALKLEQQIIGVADWLASKDECVILARGYNYPVALEAGLKLQESAYIRAKSFSGADFQHGPLAVTQPGIPFIIFKAAGPSYQGLDWLDREIAAKGGDMTIFSSEALEPEEGLSRRVIQVPSCQEWLSPFVFTVISQLLAYHTARIRGINPNAPRWLHKVTATM